MRPFHSIRRTALLALAVPLLFCARFAAGQANLSLITSAMPTNAVAGQDVILTVIITNAGPNYAYDTECTVTLPTNFTSVTWTASGSPSDSGYYETSGTGNISEYVDFFYPGSAITNTVNAVIQSNLPPTNLVITAAITPSSENTISNLIDIAVVEAADLAVSATGPSTVTAGTTVQSTVSLTNNGPDPAQDVELTVLLPSGVNLTSLPVEPGWTFEYVSPVLFASAATLPIGTNISFALNESFDSSLPAGTLQTEVSVTSSTYDSNSSNSSTNLSQHVQVSGGILLLELSSPAVAGSNISYGITLTNPGPSDAIYVSITDSISPSSFPFVSQTQLSGVPLITNVSTNGINDFLADLPAGQAVTLASLYHLPADLPSGTLITHVIAANSSTGAGASITNNASSTTLADLGVSVSAPLGAVTPNDFNYSVTVTNNGPSDAQEVSLLDTFPSGVALVNQSQTAGPPFLLANSGNDIIDYLATLPAGASASFSFGVQTPADPPPPPDADVYTNSVEVFSITTDLNSLNNIATAATGIFLPLGGMDTVGTLENTPLTIPVASLLPFVAGSSNVVAVSSITTEANSVWLTGSNVVYTPLAGFLGADEFYCNVALADGELKSLWVYVAVLPAGGPPFNILSVTYQNPNQASISSHQFSGPYLILTYTGVPGLAYDLQQASSPGGPYTNLSSSQTANSTGQVFYTYGLPANAPVSFFRVKLAPPD
jgi:uncharacterized repeat protein (TIGR01451 family)